MHGVMWDDMGGTATDCKYMTMVKVLFTTSNLSVQAQIARAAVISGDRCMTLLFMSS
jgi:hypothetical protein